MKRFQTLLIALFIGAQAFAQAPSATIGIQDFVTGFKPARGSFKAYVTPAGVDSLFAELNAAWKAAPNKKPGEPDRLDHSMATQVLILGAGGSYFTPGGCHLQERYIVREWLDRLDASEKGTNQRSSLLTSAADIFDSATYCRIERSLWDRVRAEWVLVPGMIAEQLQARAFPNPFFEDALKRTAGRVKEYEKVLKVKDLIVNGQQEAAYGLLSEYAGSGLDTQVIYFVGVRYQAMLAKGDKPESFRLLDLVAAGTTPDDKRVENLPAMYAQVDPSEGPVRFARVKRLGGPQYVVSAEFFPMKGVLKDAVTGKPYDLAQLKGKTVVVDFWWSGCGPCLAEIPDLNAFNRETRMQKDVVFLSVLSDPVLDYNDLTSAREVMKTKGVSYLVLVDNAQVNITRQLKVSSFPSKFLVNLEGRLVSPRYRTDLQISLPEVREYLKSGSIQGTK